jgi:hypothetical protein
MFQPEQIDKQTLAHILAGASFPANPDFVIWGRVPFVGRTSAVRVGALGIFAVAVYSQTCVHVIGRSERDAEAGGPLPDQAIVREIGLGEINSVGLTTAGGLGGLLTIKLGDSVGLLQDTLAGGNVMLTLSKEQLQAQRELISDLKARVAEASHPSPNKTAPHNDDVSRQLADLTELWSRGALNDVEFDTAKKRILGS